MSKYFFSNKVLVILSVTFYIISLTLPAFYTTIKVGGVPDQAGSSYIGLVVLLTGWFGLLSFMPAWLANITYFIAISRYADNFIPPTKCAYCTIFLALTSIFYWKLPADSGRYIEIVGHFGVGFYCWLLSFFLLAVACYRRQVLIDELSVDSN